MSTLPANSVAPGGIWHAAGRGVEPLAAVPRFRATTAGVPAF
jgi:hypothetical protein